MNKRIINKLSKVLKKNKLTLKYINNEPLMLIYKGFSIDFAEFIELVFRIKENKCYLELIPDLNFENIIGLKSIDKINVEFTEDKKIIFSVSEEFNENLIEVTKSMIDSLFSKDVIRYVQITNLLYWKENNK